MATKRIRISKKLEALGIPPEVATAIREVAASYLTPIHTFTLITAPAPSEAGLEYVAREGAGYILLYGSERKRVEMVAEHNVGASGLSYDIGRTFRVPIGGWLIVVHYYGTHYMTVTNVVFPRIEKHA